MYTKRELILLAGTEETRLTLHQQLKDILGEFIFITSYASETSLPNLLTNKLIVYSSHLIDSEVRHVVDDSCEVIVSRRTTNYQYIEQLFQLKEGSKVLYVNDFPETSEEAIHTLLKTGIDHIEYIPYHPGTTVTQEHLGIKTAITPGEVHLVPDHIDNVINIGVRLIDITTIMDILEHFHLKEQLGGDISDRYTRKIIELSQNISDMHKQTVQLNEHLKQVVDGVNDGIVAMDTNGKISVFNQMMEQYTGVFATHAINKNIKQILKNDQVYSFLFKEKDRSRFLTINHYNLMVYRFHLEQEGTTILIFKNADETISIEKAARHDLVHKGYIAKYTFDHIIGNSKMIENTKKVARKLAKTELPVLIQGESGTGKELYANSIHNVSSRKYQPFLAMNFSALPEELIESELFGYEEGAFTGAQKGGKKGLFEQADGGTIFLDEIGDVSLKLQARLLRVIQEMEIRRIGGNKNIPIDVRIIAATNKNLMSLIHEGQFREDLYHRLKVLCLQLPPLRERVNDIPPLIEHFIKEQAHEPVSISQEVMDSLIRNKWYGNVRELKNTISYMLAVREKEKITLEDLPNAAPPNEYIYQQPFPSSVEEDWVDAKRNETLLHSIYQINKRGERASRQKLVRESTDQGLAMTEQQIRTQLHKLQSKGYISIGRGRTGTNLTPKAVNYLENNV
ncbi:PAS domain-containing protein [Pontibacillus yanchengensis]|uniref:PAS domain-containing protein n=1 Tax=Pontibacillus yanchengensis TaxID=462910 RepID=A0ACC7VIF8_9BACI|nr:sigma 54-interacting transcriptional regulator [Pontibacillus yanchengensis]MYL54726.1 PAS domain-containing protein [Pontibacillus yanchengensis]